MFCLAGSPLLITGQVFLLPTTNEHHFLWSKASSSMSATCNAPSSLFALQYENSVYSLKLNGLIWRLEQTVVAWAKRLKTQELHKSAHNGIMRRCHKWIFRWGQSTHRLRSRIIMSAIPVWNVWISARRWRGRTNGIWTVSPDPLSGDYIARNTDLFMGGFDLPAFIWCFQYFPIKS